MRENRWKIKKRAKENQAKRCVELFQVLGGEPSGLSITPSEGVFQITEIHIPEFNETFPNGLNNRDRSGLKNMIEMGCFRDCALYFISEIVEF